MDAKSHRVHMLCIPSATYISIQSCILIHGGSTPVVRNKRPPLLMWGGEEVSYPFLLPFLISPFTIHFTSRKHFSRLTSPLLPLRTSSHSFWGLGSPVPGPLTPFSPHTPSHSPLVPLYCIRIESKHGIVFTDGTAFQGKRYAWVSALRSFN